MVSPKEIRKAIYTALNVSAVTSKLDNGSASLHHAVAPSSGSYPLVIFHKQSGTPTHQMGGSHFDSQLWLVKGICRGGSASAAEDISSAIASVLDFGSLTITGGTLMYLAREGDVSYAEVVDGEQFHHHGSLYRVTVQ